MRIDEFTSTPDGSISSDDQTRFLLFGFDITLQTIVLEGLQNIYLDGKISNSIYLDGKLVNSLYLDGNLVKSLYLDGSI